MNAEVIDGNLRKMGEALRRAGSEQCYYYPGMRGDVLANAIVPGVKSSLNERNAFEFGYGSCIAGGRSVVIFKGVGLATCLDSVQHSVINGVGAGLVVILLEDTVASSSPEIIDSRPMLDYARTLLIEPGSIESALSHLSNSFEVSEKLNTPILFRMTHELLSSKLKESPAQTIVQTKKAPAIIYSNYRARSIGSWPDRVEGYEAKQVAIQAYVDTLYTARTSSPVSDLVFGCSQAGNKSATLVEHYPIASEIRQYYKANQPQVHEIGSNYAQRALAAGEPIQLDSSNMIVATFPAMQDWEKVLSKIDKTHYDLVIADEGRYTSDSTQLVDLCLCMGSSIALCGGVSKQTGTRNLAIVGDFAYLFNAYPSIIEAAARGVDMDIILLDDGKASSTGGQGGIVPIQTEDLRSYLSEIAEFDYENLPSEIITYNTAGIRLFRIQK